MNSAFWFAFEGIVQFCVNRSEEQSEVWEVPCDSDSHPPTEDSAKPSAEHYYLNC